MQLASLGLSDAPWMVLVGRRRQDEPRNMAHTRPVSRDPRRDARGLFIRSQRTDHPRVALAPYVDAFQVRVDCFLRYAGLS